MKFDHFINHLYPDVFSTAIKDLYVAHQYANEYYRSYCPVIVYKELDRKSSMPNQDLASLWGEQAGGLRIGRTLQIKLYPDFNVEERQTHMKFGATEITREVRFAAGILELKRVDLYPEMGDHIEYGGYEYEITRVYVRTEDLWQQTNQPLHVSMDAYIYRPGDVKPKSRYDYRKV
jgi:hypothetical protein